MEAIRDFTGELGGDGQPNDYLVGKSRCSSLMSGQRKSGGSGTKAGGGFLQLQHGRPGNQMGIPGILGVVGEGIEVFNLGQMALGTISQPEGTFQILHNGVDGRTTACGSGH